MPNESCVRVYVSRMPIGEFKSLLEYNIADRLVKKLSLSHIRAIRSIMSSVGLNLSLFVLPSAQYRVLFIIGSDGSMLACRVIFFVNTLL